MPAIQYKVHMMAWSIDVGDAKMLLNIPLQ